MPVDLKELLNGQAVAHITHGIVTGPENYAATQALFGQEKIGEYLFGVADFTLAEKVKFSTADLRGFAATDREVAKLTRPRWLVALVAPQDFVYGVSRMWQVFAEEVGWESEVCRSRNDAQAWVIRSVKKKFGIELQEFVQEM
jgi:hypothetical protein